MKQIVRIIFIILPFFLNAQRNGVDRNHINDRLRFQAVKEKMEKAVENGNITREQADERYKQYRAKQTLSSTVKQDRVLADHYKKLGINNLEKTKNKLLDQGIPSSQIDAVLGGLLRLVHAAKMDKENFEMNPRIEAYFKDRLELTDSQVGYIMRYARRLARIGKGDPRND